jgi:electron transport complex protein RnfC
LSKRFSFKGGICIPSKKKQTEQLAIETFPAPSNVTIPLQQHTGVIAHPVVKRGDHVTIGQLIAEAAEQNSLAIHSSVSGEVQSIGLFPHPTGKQVLAIEIDNNGHDDKANIQPFDRPWRDAAPGELVQKIQSCGIAGMGGEGIPTYLKLSTHSKKPIDTVLLNCLESEPYLCADSRLAIEKTKELLNGILIVKKITGATNAVIAVGDKRAAVIQAFSSWLSDPCYKDISLVRLQQKYPQGSERQLINAITKRSIPSGGSSMDIGCVVFNVSTTLAIHEAIIDGTPLYQRVISVCGPTIKSPKNLLVRLGTPIGKILEACEIDLQSTKKIIMGGPMRGAAQTDLEAPVIKTTTGLFAYDKTTPALQTHPCINCGKCVKYCPAKLIPARIAESVRLNKLDEAVDWNILDCIECGACAYICPAKINLVHYIRLGKHNLNIAKQIERSRKNVILKGNITK